MSEPIRAGNEPVEVELEAGKRYSFCTCGKSQKQPFCDGAHKGSEFMPHSFTVTEENKKCWLCMCKKTGDRPFCDGSHNK